MGEILYIVIPCYNEEKVLYETSRRLKMKFDELIISRKIDCNSRVIFVNDGSIDSTWNIIEELHNTCDLFSGIKLSRNRGHQNALFAGIYTVKDFANVIITMDADLQDDINAIDEMLENYFKGFDIVYGVRSKREKDTAFKRLTAEGFYKLINSIGGDLIAGHADYRLMSKRAVDGLCKYKEVNLFLRGIVPMIGYTSTTVMYERNERFAGESKYTLKKMVSFALEGITSLSIQPLRIVTVMGLSVFTISIIMLIYVVVRYFMGKTVTGWSSITVSIWTIGGLLLLSIGIIGEYIGKIYIETKERPRFFIDKFIHNSNREGYNE